MAEERRAELDLPAIWICPPDTESQVVIKSCIFESAGEDEECNTLKDVPYNHVGGNFNLECASISGKVNKPLVVRYDGDRLILKVLLMSRDKKEILGNRGVVAVVGRKRLWGNQWFFAPTQSLTAAQLDRTERYEYTSPLNSEVYHDYDLLVSTVPFGSSESARSWPPSFSDASSGTTFEVTRADEERGTSLAILQIQYKSMLIKISRVTFKYPPIAEFARIFGPIGAIIGMYKAYADWRRKKRRVRARTDSDIA